jgi:hypothetical protein
MGFGFERTVGLALADHEIGSISIKNSILNI